MAHTTGQVLDRKVRTLRPAVSAASFSDGIDLDSTKASAYHTSGRFVKTSIVVAVVAFIAYSMFGHVFANVQVVGLVAALIAMYAGRRAYAIYRGEDYSANMWATHSLRTALVSDWGAVAAGVVVVAALYALPLATVAAVLGCGVVGAYTVRALRNF